MARAVRSAIFLTAFFVMGDASAQPHVVQRPAVQHPAIVSYVHAWHTPTPDKTAPVDEHGRTELALVALNTQEHVELVALTPRGSFSGRDLDRAAHLLREPSSGNEHPIEPRTLDALYRIQLHFTAQEIRVISGYRTPAAIASARGSNHGRGRAIDIVVPGAADEDVAKFARELGFMGVGVYPVSGFVHVDVRDRSYFWIDSSAPGKRNRERGILGDVAARADRDAVARGEHGAPALLVSSDVDAAWGGAPSSSSASAVEEEDE